MKTKTQRDLEAAKQLLEDHATKGKAIIEKASEENRSRSDEENAEVAEHQAAMATCRKNIERLEAELAVEEDIGSLGIKLGVKDEQPNARPRAPQSYGEQFVNSEGYKRAKADGFTGSWKTGRLELGAKTLLTEGDNISLATGTPGEGAPLIPIDQRPGVLPILFQRLTVEDLLASGTTDSNAVRYVVESLADSGAAVVPEGGEKPESAFEFDQADEAVKKVATWLPVTDEMLEDAQQITSYINSRLALFVRTEAEFQLLGGAGGSNLLGLLPRIPVANRFVSSDADTPNAADHIYAALTVARASFLEPDGVVVNPVDWADLRLLKDDNLNYIGGSPFSNTGQGEPGESIWGKRVVITTACQPGSAVVGAFGTAAQVFNRGGLTVEASNSHDTFFIENKTAIRAERRMALAVYRPEAFAIADLGYAS